MICPDNTIISYIILLSMLSSFGLLTAELVHYFDCPQYYCNFLYGVIIALYIMENWSLLVDLQKKTSNGGLNCSYFVVQT